MNENAFIIIKIKQFCPNNPELGSIGGKSNV